MKKLKKYLHLIRSFLEERGLSIQRVGLPEGHEIDVLTLLLERLPVDGTDFQLVQVGANDGTMDDPVHRYILERGWSCLLIEPIPSVFERLIETYRGRPGTNLENCAVAEHNGVVTMYRVAPDPSLPPYTQALASFDRRVILKQERTVPGIGRHIVPIEVPALTMRSLLDRHAIDHIHLLAIDTEGFDAKVVRMTLDSGRRPDIIYFESTHLSLTDKRDCGSQLAEAGYRYLTIGRDTIAVREVSSSSDRREGADHVQTGTAI